MSSHTNDAYREGWDRIFGRFAKAYLDAQVRHIIRHGPDVAVNMYPDRPTFEEIVARLETVIFVTNRLDASLVPKHGACVPYYVNVKDKHIARWHEIIVKHWAGCYLNCSVDETHMIAGLQRGFIDLERHALTEEEHFTLVPKPQCEAERDEAWRAGLNVIRNIVGRGLVLWEGLLWVDGRCRIPMLFPHDKREAEIRATLRALISRGILPSRD